MHIGHRKSLSSSSHRSTPASFSARLNAAAAAAAGDGDRFGVSGDGFTTAGTTAPVETSSISLYACRNSLSLSLCVYIYVCDYISHCVCVELEIISLFGFGIEMWERKREKKKKKKKSGSGAHCLSCEGENRPQDQAQRFLNFVLFWLLKFSLLLLYI